MIELKDSEIIQILPTALAGETEVKCVSYAIHKQIEKLIGWCNTIGVYTAIDLLDADKLEILATELNAPFYDTTLNIEEKRKLVKNALVWFITAGTPAAVEDLVQSVFGDGRVVEWFDEEEDPYTFRIETASPVSPATEAYFRKMIQRTKNVRSYLSSLDSSGRIDQNIYFGMMATSRPEIVILNSSIS